VSVQQEHADVDRPIPSNPRSSPAPQAMPAAAGAAVHLAIHRRPAGSVIRPCHLGNARTSDPVASAGPTRPAERIVPITCRRVNALTFKRWGISQSKHAFILGGTASAAGAGAAPAYNNWWQPPRRQLCQANQWPNIGAGDLPSAI
jgi:hypothetical protein